MNRWFFHWASWVGDPPTPEHHLHDLCHVWGIAFEHPKSSRVQGGSPWGDFTNLHPPWEVAKNSHTLGELDPLFVGFPLVLFCWWFFFGGEVVGPGTFGRTIPCQPSRHIFRNFSNHFHLFPAPHPPPPRGWRGFHPKNIQKRPSLAPRAWRSTAWAWPKVQRSSPPGVDAKWVEKIPNFWLLPKKSPLHTVERFVIFSSSQNWGCYCWWFRIWLTGWNGNGIPLFTRFYGNTRRLGRISEPSTVV